MEEKSTQVVPVESQPTTAPKSNKKLWLIIGAGFGFLLIAAVGIAAVFLVSNHLYNQNTYSNGNQEAAIDVLDPQAATDKLNRNLIAALETSGSDFLSDPTQTLDDPWALFNVLTNGEDINSAEMEFDVNLQDDEQNIKIKLATKIQKTQNDKLALEGVLTVNGNVPNIGDISDLKVDIVLLDDEIFIRINDLPESITSDSSTAMLALFENKWLRLPLDNTSGLLDSFGGVDISEDTSDDEDTLDSLIELWEEEPPLQNGRTAPSRKVNGVSLDCMIVEINPKAFDESFETSEPIEICSANGGRTPVYVGFTNSEDGVTSNFALTLLSVNENVNIVAPSGDVLDLESLLGGSF